MTAYWKDLFREIKNTFGRFLSLIIITSLGAASIVGIQAASVDMRNIADATYKEHNLYDLQIKSTTGFTDDALSALENTAGVLSVMPTTIYDVFVNVNNENRAVRTYALPENINQLTVIDGRLPENPGECAVEQRLFNESHLQIGESITLNLDNPLHYDSIFSNDTFTIVGIVSSPLYINFQRGNTSLGDGSLQYYMVLHPDTYKLNIFTDVYLLMDGSREMDNLSEEYYTAAEEWKRRIEETAGAREWFVFTRKDGIAFDSYYQDTLRLQQIGYVFPLVFFLVAVMVTLTTMSRMVEEQRTQIGIYKALGFPPLSIMAKYLLYAFFSSLIGSVTGIIWGSKVFPFIIADAYSHLYTMPPIEMPIPVFISAIAVAASVLSVTLVTLWTYLNSMGGAPALLMRPKSPISGKRVLLERISPVWKRLGFFSKVTARNIFRYKKRFLMSLAGVAGCSALLLTGFGLSDSIASVGDLQYEIIVEYDARAYLKEITNEDQYAELNALLPPTTRHMYIREEVVTATNAGNGLSASIIVPIDSITAPPDSYIGKFINMYNPHTGRSVTMTSSSVIVTDKLARVMGVEAGGRFDIVYSDGRTFTVTATDITDNYMNHFIYISPDIYQEIFGENPYPNSILIFAENMDFAAPLLENENVRAVIHNDEVKTIVSESTDAMGVVTLALIVIACMLAFVVLFNLTNINITERVRELATIKVLGFYDAELAMYIYRENAVVTVLGILLGLIGGIFLHGFVITTTEIDVLKFPKMIQTQSYIYSALLSLFFAALVNFVMNFKLSRIDMVESLKNVE